MKLQKKDANGSKTYNIEECLEKISGINDTVDDINAKLEKISHIEANAEVNQEAFSNVKIGSTTIAADSKKDTLNMVAGSNIILTPDATNDKITIASTNTPTFTNLTTTNLSTTNLTTSGEIEIYGATPHIDFHYGNSTEDKTSRIIETVSGKIDIQAGLFNNGQKVVLESDLETTSIELTAIEVEITDSNGVKKKVKRLENLSYTAKYVPVIPAVFVRIYGKINKEVNMKVGYEYDILNIGSHGPNWQTALAVKSAKHIGAVAKNGNVISVRPLESGISGYDVYIAGFWFV